MNESHKIRVAILYGGRSGEHEVSIASATSVIQNLDRTLFEPIPIGIDKKGGWFLGDDLSSLIVQNDPDRFLFHPGSIGQFQSISKTQRLLGENARLFDVIFPVVHGVLCEDGTLQGLLEQVNIPYVGCGVLSSALGMDKDFSKRIIQAAGLKIAPYLHFKKTHWEAYSDDICREINTQLIYPLFIKPANTGSSVGVNKVKTPSELTAAIAEAFLYDTKVVIEQGIQAQEIEVAVLESLEGNAEPIISVPGQVTPSAQHEFYSYTSKYLDKTGASLTIPAILTEKLAAKIKNAAKIIFKALDCEGFARIDLFLEKGTDDIYFNEINTLPGFTEISMYPKLMVASGMTYKGLLTHLIQLALNRQTQKNSLLREYNNAIK